MIMSSWVIRIAAMATPSHGLRRAIPAKPIWSSDDGECAEIDRYRSLH
jgi:hypothetical protein